MKKEELAIIARVLMDELGDSERVAKILSDIKYYATLGTVSTIKNGMYLVDLMEKRDAEEENEDMMNETAVTTDSEDLKFIEITDPAACDECSAVIETRDAIEYKENLICLDCSVEDGLISYNLYDEHV